MSRGGHGRRAEVHRCRRLGAAHRAKAYDTLLHNALTGKGAMPARGGTSPDDYSDFEIGRAVVYMANNSGGKLRGTGAASAGRGSGCRCKRRRTGGGRIRCAGALASRRGRWRPGSVPQAPRRPQARAERGRIASRQGAVQQVCQACHAAGVLNAPKFGDKDAWAPRLKEPMDTVYNYALHGKGAMPPKGGSTASDADVKAAVDYMVSAAK